MLYVIAHGYNNVSRVPQENIVYLVSDLQHIQNAHLPFVFTDGHAYNEVTQFYTARESARTIDLEWSMIEATDWHNTTENTQRKRIKEAEFLIKSDVPLQCLIGLIVYNETAKSRLEQIIREATLGISVIVRRDYYYG